MKAVVSGAAQQRYLHILVVTSCEALLKLPNLSLRMQTIGCRAAILAVPYSSQIMHYSDTGRRPWVKFFFFT